MRDSLFARSRRGRLTELEFALVKMGGIERLGDAEKVSCY